MTYPGTRQVEFEDIYLKMAQNGSAFAVAQLNRKWDKDTPVDRSPLLMAFKEATDYLDRVCPMPDNTEHEERGEI